MGNVCSGQHRGTSVRSEKHDFSCGFSGTNASSAGGVPPSDTSESAPDALWKESPPKGLPSPSGDSSSHDAVAFSFSSFGCDSFAARRFATGFFGDVPFLGERMPLDVRFGGGFDVAPFRAGASAPAASSSRRSPRSTDGSVGSGGGRIAARAFDFGVFGAADGVGGDATTLRGVGSSPLSDALSGGVSSTGAAAAGAAAAAAFFASTTRATL